MPKFRTDPKWKDIRRHRRSTQPYKIKVKKDGIAEDITGWTIYFTVKENMNDDDTESGGGEAKIAKDITIHTDPTNGQTLITLSSSDTNLTPGNYYYDIKYKDDEDNIAVLFRGRIKIIKPVTTRT